MAASLALPLLALAALPAALRLGRARAEGPESLALASGIALAWCMLGGMLLCSGGLLSAPHVWGWLLLGGLASLALGGRGFSLRRWFESWRGHSATALLVPPLGLILAMSCVPPWYRDSLVYHLALPRSFAQHGGYTWPDGNLFAAFPLGWESALALLHALGGAPDFEPAFNPRLAGAWTLGAAALATLALARAAGATPLLSATAGTLLMLLPTAIEFGASAYVENALLLFGVLAFWWLLRARDGELPWWGSACWVGFACWVKLPALALLAYLAILAPLAECLRRDALEPRAWFRRALLWATLAGGIGSPFYLRNLWLHGNPIFPLGYALFGGNGWDDWRSWAYGVTLANYGHGREALDYLLLPWRLFTERRFEGGFEGSFGPLLALGLPLGWWLGRRASETDALHRHAPWLLAWVLWLTLFWALTVQQARFYLLAAPVLLALLTSSISRLRGVAMPHAAALCVAALLALQLAWSAAPIQQLWKRQATSAWLAGGLSRDALLARMLPETWPATRELPKWVPEDGRVWLVWMRGYTYYLPRKTRVDSVFEAWRLEALLDESRDPQTLRASLEGDGISHLLVNHRFFLAGGNADLRPGRTDLLQARFRAAVEQGALQRVESWGPVALYRVAGPSIGMSPRPD